MEKKQQQNTTIQQQRRKKSPALSRRYTVTNPSDNYLWGSVDLHRLRHFIKFSIIVNAKNKTTKEEPQNETKQIY